MKDTHRILIKKARIVDHRSAHHGQQKDLLLTEGRIEAIEDNIDASEQDQLVEVENLHVSPGWFDLRANFRDPGHEDKEDLRSGALAALKGGFTGVALSPDTEPVLDSKADLEYIYRKSENSPLRIYPFGAFTKGLKGEELSEMYDMHQAGAVGFSDGGHSLENSAVLKLALQYARNFAPALHLRPADVGLRDLGVMHEGSQSTWLGLRGSPSLTEAMGLRRDLLLAEYAETKVHFTGISAAESVVIIKENSPLCSADINALNLLFSDEDLADYNTDLKLSPPLRTRADQEALIEALKEGTIKIICSDHQPHTIEDKQCEFDLAAYGAASLEGFFGALWHRLHKDLSLAEFIPMISEHPRSLLGLETSQLAVGARAELTLFDPDQQWTLQKETLESKAANQALLNRPLRGKALGIIQDETLLRF